MIYFIWDSGSGAIKIGISNNPARRLEGFQVGNSNPLFLLGTVEGDESAEAVLHAKFSALRISGEWFRATPELLHFVRKTIYREPAEERAESDQPTPRVARAAEWLEGRFREKSEWTAAEIRAAAARDGISKNALYSPEVASLPIKKWPRINSQGEKEWVWSARDGWPLGIAS